jgi:hypothetical protein
MITVEDIKSLDYNVTTSLKNRIIASKEYSDIGVPIVLSYRVKENHLRIVKYGYYKSLEGVTFRELEDVKSYTLYDGRLRDKAHLEQLIEDVLYQYKH